MSTTQEATQVQDYVDVNGVHTYYEVQGQGDPVVMLHGGFCTVETFGAQTTALAEHYRVYLPERRGHGRTADVDGPITYENMAEDTIAFMDDLGITNAHLVGWSDGGNVGLEVALARPDLVKKLVFMGAVAHLDGYKPEMLEQLQNLTADSLPPMLRGAYDALSPDGPDHFATVVEKLKAEWSVSPAHELSDLEALQAPTLVIFGDDDVITLKHAGELADAIPEAQVACVPGTDHVLLFEKPDLVNRIILDFLADEQAPKLFAERHEG
jgi:pimeloyl-ACP methyl ester carboxylesterase